MYVFVCDGSRLSLASSRVCTFARVKRYSVVRSFCCSLLLLFGDSVVDFDHCVCVCGGVLSPCFVVWFLVFV